jgi:hypothetical protein
MVQVLPYVPSFGERLLPVLAQAGSDVAQGIQKRNAQSALQRLLSGQTQSSPAQGGVSQVQNTVPQQNPQNLSPSQILQTYPLLEQFAGKGGADAFLRAQSEQQKLSEKQRIQSRKEEVEAHKLTQGYREKLLEGYEGTKRTLTQLGRLKTLNQNEALATPVLAKLADTFGVPLSVLSNPASEEFQKLSQDLLSNITKYFGNRILQVEVENFLKTIPTLSNSKEGRERIIKNMEMLLEPQKLAYEAYKDIRKKGGKIPHEQILEKIEPNLDQLAEDFKNASGAGNAEAIPILAPNGQTYLVPPDKVDAALKAGGRAQ